MMSTTVPSNRMCGLWTTICQRCEMRIVVVCITSTSTYNPKMLHLQGWCSSRVSMFTAMCTQSVKWIYIYLYVHKKSSPFFWQHLNSASHAVYCARSHIYKHWRHRWKSIFMFLALLNHPFCRLSILFVCWYLHKQINIQCETITHNKHKGPSPSISQH